MTGLHHLHHRPDARPRDAHHPASTTAAARCARCRSSARRCTASAAAPAPTSARPIARSAGTSSATSTPARSVWSSRRSTTVWRRCRSRRVSASPATPARRSARSGFPLPRQILDVRKMVVEEKGLPRAKRSMLESSPAPAVRRAARIGGAAPAPADAAAADVRGRQAARPEDAKRGGAACRPWPRRPPARPLLRGRRTLPDLARRLSPTGPAARRSPLPRCMTDRLYPEKGEATVAIMPALGAQWSCRPGSTAAVCPRTTRATSRTPPDGRADDQALERVRADWIVSGSAVASRR